MTALRFVPVSLATMEREQKGEVLCGRAAHTPVKICFSIFFKNLDLVQKTPFRNLDLVQKMTYKNRDLVRIDALENFYEKKNH